jgi:hypothetical protein
MTYPPQQPGGYGQQPGGYGQQPDPYGRPQPGGYPASGPQQQPGYGGTQQFGQPDPYGRPQQGGYPPQTGPQPQQGYPQYGQQDQWGQPQQGGYDPNQQQGFGGYDPYGGGGFGDGPPPKKKKTGLIIGIVAGAVVILGGGGTALALALSGDDQNAAAPPASSSSPAPTSAPKTSTPKSKSTSPTSPSTKSTKPVGGPAPGGKASSQELFDSTIAAYNAGDEKALGDVICRSVYEGTTGQIPKVTVKLTGTPADTGDKSSVRYSATDGTATKVGTMSGAKESGLWCLSNVKADGS